MNPFFLTAQAFAGHVVATTSQGILSTITRDFESLVNALGPTVLPSLDQMIQLYYSGRVKEMAPYHYVGGGGVLDFNMSEDDILSLISLMHGCDLRRGPAMRPDNELKRQLWSKVLDQKQPFYAPHMLRRWLRRVNLDYDDDDVDTKRNNFASMLSGVLKQQGFPAEVQQRPFVNENEDVTASQVMLWTRLGLIDPNRADDYLKGFGLSANDRSLAITDRLTPVGVGDMMAFANVRALDAEWSEKWGLDVEKPDWWDEWAKRNGMNYLVDPARAYGSAAVVNPDESLTSSETTTVGDAVWRSRYKMPSLGDLAQILHRFRGDPANPNTWTYPPTVFSRAGGMTVTGSGAKPLTLDEANEFLDANGIPPRLRAHYYNLMYAPLNLRHIQLIVRYLPTDMPTVAAWLQDNGISPSQSTILASAYMAKRQDELNAPIVKQRERALVKLQQSIESAYATGTLSNEDAASELVANGMDQAAAITSLAAVDVKVANDLSDQVIKRARSDVFAGIVPVGSIGPRLVQAGIAAPRAAQLVATWTAQLTLGRKTLGTEKILRYMRKGFISRDNAILRLANLGWSGTDTLLLLHEVQAEIAADTAKTLAAGERDKAASERAIERQLGKTARLANTLISRLKTLTPVNKLVKWYKDGVWSESKVRDRLRLLGYTDDVIDAMLLDALHVAPKAAKP